jgi:hypothetical protein
MREEQALKQQELETKHERAREDLEDIENELRAAQQQASMLSVKQEKAVQKRDLQHRESVAREQTKMDAELQSLKASAQITAMHEQHTLATRLQELTMKQHERSMAEKMQELTMKQYEENIALMEGMIAHKQKAKALEATQEKLKAKMQSLGLDADILLEPPRTPVGKLENNAANALQPRAAIFDTPAAK